MAVERAVIGTGRGGVVRGLAAAALLAAGPILVVAGCERHDEQPRPAAGNPPAAPATAKEPEFTKVSLDGTTFKLELSLDEQKRFKGLSDRTEIPADGGMLFVFPQPQRLYFVMRDCPIPIDIVFLDGSGRITALHKMAAEAPRGPGEGKPGEVSQIYEDRLKRYSSKYDAQYVIELKGNTLDGLKLKEGQQIKIDAGLKARAR
ncbi:MAG: DUF192 domain-containing protein [Phycisphaerales bacterium]|nr:DUF192 domain-containing protein [Phycisphaerales bacterium]